MHNSSHFIVSAGLWIIIICSIFPIQIYSGLTQSYGLIIIFSTLLVYIGSYTPDLDKKSTKIIPLSNHLDQKYRDFFIRPVQKKFNSFGHREITHSLNGALRIFLRTLPLIILVSVFGVCFQVMLYYRNDVLITVQYMLQGRQIITPLDLFDKNAYFILGLAFNSIAFTFGYLNHLWVDSITIKGIVWIFRTKIENDSNKTKTEIRWKGYIRTGSINEKLGVLYFLMLDLILYFILFFLLPTIPLLIVRVTIPVLTIILVYYLGTIFRNEKFAERLLAMDLCKICYQPMILRTNGINYGEKVYWECKNCKKTFTAPQNLKKEHPHPFISRKMPFTLLIFLDILLLPIFFLSFVTRHLIFPLLALAIGILSLYLVVRYEKQEKIKELNHPTEPI